MNITALRPRFVKYLEPVAEVFVRLGITPNQISLLALVAGGACAFLFFRREFLLGSLALFVSAVFDLIDGSVARKTNAHTDFGAVFDWIVDKYVDAIALLGIGLSGIAVVSQFVAVPPGTDFAIVTIAIIGSLMNTFIKPVVYAEIGYREKVEGKIDDPLEGVGFFGRPETFLVLIIGGISGFIWAAVIIIAVCTNLSAIQRIIYLYRTLS
ncbi:MULTISPECIES: CDP-alcohol phosphatidyltransferase family protein [unclassified Methanoregula]|uniref:CDP-alcohol phosphatidyltransferase family protein n=1 Tax=unclassified Methanoregula TaxID=2649730 RepID=UPI0009C5D984|nr:MULTISPECIES: CDP-alcohol phosphatidyltransferase family protein [unclassified Methanoregula]OPX63920.1 MAG: Archaetidylinositol phosphate synthase [Methanoregula sp. PtaB.Bin085]OPY35472.1 MAG: Archaetidylinositol phosphate synthase [Methanoregula sp. PtaU1.Bin006]